MSHVFTDGLLVGGIVGLFLGYEFGGWRAARRAARNTYRSVRGR